MIYSRTAEYAIRALGYLARRPEGAFTGVREVSRNTGVPYAYIAKIFRALTRGRVVESLHGRRGGFRLVRAPSRISLKEVILMVDSGRRSLINRCIMGMSDCNSRNPCLLHHLWADTSQKIDRRLESCTLLDSFAMSDRFPRGRRDRKILSQRVRNVFQ